MKQLFICFFILFSCISLTAQKENYSFTNYTNLQGLPDNKVQSILQDSRGFLWIGTSEGLSRFDGNHFKNFFSTKEDTILQSDFFTNIFEYRKGHLVMNNGNHLICLNTYTQKFYLPNLPVMQINGCFLNKPANGRGYYLYCWNKAYLLNDDLTIQTTIEKPELCKENANLSVFSLTDSVMLLQINSSFYYYFTATKQTQKLNLDFHFKDKSYLPYFRYFDPEAKKMYFTEYQTGLFSYSLISHQLELLNKAANGLPYTNGFVYRVMPKGEKELWFLTNEGIHIFDKTSKSISILKAEANNRTSLIDNTVFTGYTDGEGNIWFGTVNGLSKLNANKLGIKSWSKNFRDQNGNGWMSIVKGKDDHIYVTKYNDKAYQLNTSTNYFAALQHPLNMGSWNLFIKGNEIIRTGAGNQLLSFNTATKQFKVINTLKPYYPDIEIIVLGFISKKGDEWYSANRNGGFVRRIANTGQVKTYKKEDPANAFTNTYYTTYSESDNGDLWFGVNKSNKLLHWKYKEDHFEEIDLSLIPGKKNALTSGINFVTQDTANNIWVAFDGSGLVCFNLKQKSIQHYTISDGLPSSLLFGMEFDLQNRLWISTAKGLSCFIIAENKFVNFNKENGLPDDNFMDYCNFFDRSKNEMWFGTRSELISFTPDQMLNNRKERIPVYIDEIFLNGKKFQDTVLQNLSFRSYENNLQFLFAGIDLNNGQDIAYSYKMEGADKDWIFIGNNQSATYANLAPGHYTFKVRAKHRGDNQWHEMQEPLQIFIATPWHKSWWFYAMVIISVGLLIWYLIRSYYHQKIEKQKSVIEKQQAVEEERNRIAADMHDDLGSGLTKITYLSQMALQKDNNKEDLGNIQKTSTALVENMSEIIWAMKEENNTLEDLIYYIKRYAMEYSADNQLNCTIHLPEKLYPRMVAGQNRRNIFLAIKEILHNIVKHAKAKNITISVFYHQFWLIEIRDDGIGIVQNNPIAEGNGMNNIRKRIAAVRGTVEFSSDNGTVVLLKIPL